MSDGAPDLFEKQIKTKLCTSTRYDAGRRITTVPSPNPPPTLPPRRKPGNNSHRKLLRPTYFMGHRKKTARRARDERRRAAQCVSLAPVSTITTLEQRANPPRVSVSGEAPPKRRDQKAPTRSAPANRLTPPLPATAIPSVMTWRGNGIKKPINGKSAEEVAKRGGKRQERHRMGEHHDDDAPVLV